MKALGLTCGIGSMLIGARSAGFDVVGNVEWRKYYHTGTFEKNFPGAYMVKDRRDAPQPKDIDLAMGHPECGNYSNLRTSVRKYDDPGDIPLFIELIKWAGPEFFVMDNLPRSLIAVPIDRYAEELPEYDLFPEWISNYHYGNTQIHRNRFFLIGAKRRWKFVFRPGEFEHDKKLRDVIGDLPIHRDIYEINHVHRNPDYVLPCGWSARQIGISRKNNHITLKEFQDYIRDFPSHRSFEYINRKGERMKRPGYCKISLDRPSPVMTGGGSAPDNHYREDTLLPLTMRERARIQGCPDDFIFYPLDFMEKNTMYSYIYKQIGKFMPVEFCTFVAKQIAAHLKGESFEASGKRFIKPSSFVNEAKIRLCSIRERRKEWCEACWIRDCPFMKQKTVFLPLKNAPDHASAVEGSPRIRKYSTKPVKRIAKSLTIVEKTGSDTRVEIVNLRKGPIPEDYVGGVKYEEKFLGELIREDGSYYSRLERRRYYSPIERNHPAKTPVHIARWAIQTYTEPNDWVLDPTAGTGTTIVEALRLGRNAVGMEIEYADVMRENARINNPEKKEYRIIDGDAREIGKHISDLEFSLVVNNPPYSGDVRQSGLVKKVYYNRRLSNLAFLGENKEYWEAMKSIYDQCIGRLKKKGKFVVGIKDMMRNRRPFLLPEKFGDLLIDLGLKYVGMTVLKHYPLTLHLNTYEKIHGVRPPLYQTILVFEK